MRDSTSLFEVRHVSSIRRARATGATGSHGTFVFEGALFLDNRNRVGTLVYPLYGKVHGGQPALPGQWLGLVVTRLEYDVSCR